MAGRGGAGTVPAGHTGGPRAGVGGGVRQTGVKLTCLAENGVDGMVDDTSYFFPHHFDEGARGNLYIEQVLVARDVFELWNPCVVALRGKVTLKVLQEVCPYGE